MSEKIDEKLLKGLRFKDSKSKTVTEDGRKVKKFIPVDRPLKAEDVLAVKRITGGSVSFVTADGCKYTADSKGNVIQTVGPVVVEAEDEKKNNGKEQ